jgi:GNAT superfamily N-acetyltransferase
MEVRVRVETFRGREIEPYLEQLGDLRIRVFRDWPYLYDGDRDYELRYLAKYAAAPSSFIAIAIDGDRVVGASTAIALADAEPEFRDPIAAHGLDAERVIYFGESVLLPEYRGRGFGHRFFDAREAEGRSRPGVTDAIFAAVIRTDADPRRPANHRSLESFWRSRGYEKLADVCARYEWLEVGEFEETEHTLQFWRRRLDGEPLRFREEPAP